MERRRTTGFRYGLIVVLGISMGIQNAAARKLAVPDLTTTVLTMTITGITADSPIAGKSGARTGRRGLTVVAMFAGAIVGAVLIVHLQMVYPLAIALIVAATVAGTTRVLGASNPAWTRVDPWHAAGRPGRAPTLRSEVAVPACWCGVV